MKRYISLVLAAVVLICSLAVPSYASEMTGNYINVLDYSFVNGSDGYFFYVDSGVNKANFTLPIKVMANFVDIIFHTNDAVPLSLKYSYGSDSYPDSALTIVSLGNNYFRAYGNVSQTGLNSITLFFEFDRFSWVSFDKFLYWESDEFFYSVMASCDILAKDYTETIHYNPNDLINDRVFHSTDNYNDLYLSLFLYSNEWQKFDFLEFTFLTDSATINSINAYMGDQVIPFTVSFLDNGSSSVGTSIVVSIVLDLRSLNRSSAEVPMICVNGSLDFDSVCMVSILSVAGSISSSLPTSEVFFLRRIWNSIVSGFTDLTATLSTHFNNIQSSIDTWGQSIVSAINGDSSSVDQVVDQMGEQAGQVQQNNDALQQLQKPVIDSNTSDITGIVSPSNTVKYTLFLTRIMNAPILADVIMLAMIFSLAAYVLFGKR